MSDSTDKRASGCPVAYGLDIFGDRWTLLVIREMMLGGKRTYGEFLAMDEGISTNILADRLKRLEADGVVQKMRDPDNYRSYLYRLTDKGLDLAPVILEIIRWSGKYDLRPIALREMPDRIARDRPGLEQEIRARRA